MVPMLDERTVVPLKLRGQVLETLHSAHQGVLGMWLRAEQSQNIRQSETNLPWRYRQ